VIFPAAWRATGFELLTRCRLACGQRDEAGVAARRAQALADALGLRVPAAMAGGAAAAVALESGDPRHAAELRRLGHRHLHRRTRPGTADGTRVESLTERELQVGRLIVDRRTNTQIAAELFLSPKTVETHDRNLFDKLGVASRVEVARVIERADREAHKPAPR